MNFIKVNYDFFNLALYHGWKFLNDENNLRNLFDISPPDTPIVLIYFLDDLKYASVSDWIRAQKHAFGGHFADFNTVCWGDYCPFGPKIRGAIERPDSKIEQVLFMPGSNKTLVPRSSSRIINYECKTQRSELKLQRREKHKLTKQIKTSHMLD